MHLLLENFWLIWYIIGVIGCIIVHASRVREGLDVTISDIFWSLILSASGPILLFLVVIEVLSELKLTDKVVFKGRKR